MTATPPKPYVFLTKEEVALWDALAAYPDLCIGGTVMAYIDEWWKVGHPAQQTPGGFPNPFFPDGQMDEA